MTKKILNLQQWLCVFLLFIMSLPAGTAFSQEQEIPPLDPAVKTGKLSNGFTYFIRKNTEPNNRVVMYLANKVGSILETDAEQGLAHFVEHMNFNGTTHFPKNELVDYLQKAGIRFGADLNAYTGFDQTVYQLPLPTDDPELLQNGFRVMRDWAQEALMDGEEIDKERGVILEEKRGGKGADQRMRDQYLPMLLNHSHYANRLPIGTEEVLTGFTHETIRNFYKKWYRPDLQALIVVGDIDVEATEKTIISLFSDLKIPDNKLERQVYSVPLTGKNQFMSVTDKEMTHTVMQVIIKHPEQKVKTVADFRQSLLRSLYNQLVGARFSELLQQADPPFIQAGNSMNDFLGGLDAFTLFVAAKPGELERGAKAMLTEVERVKRFGFTETELDRAKSNYLTSLETAYAERDKRKSESYVEEYLEYFLEGIASPGIDYEYPLAKKNLASVTLEEVNALGSAWYTDINRDVLILAPETEKAGLPDEQTVNHWIQEVKNQDLAAYDDQVSNEPLLAEKPRAGKIVSRQDRADIGVTELVLNNGIKVQLKPTNFKNDEIRFYGFSPGGTALYSDADYYSASNAASIVGSSGVGDYNPIRLRKYLAGKKVSVQPGISERTESISGSSGKADLETAFEMIYLYFTRPRLDMDMFRGAIERQKASLANRMNDPEAVFSDSINAALYNRNIRRAGLTLEALEKIDPDRSLAIYRERFADASDFTFTFVGSFKEEELVPLLEQYLATLPSSKRTEEAPDLGIYPPDKGFALTVRKGQEEKAAVRLVYAGDYTYSEAENLQMDALESVLNIKLIERIREKESGVYNISARTSVGKFPRNRYTVSIAFGCDPARVDYLTEAVLEELEKIRQTGAEPVDISKFVAEQTRVTEVQLKENNFWMNYLVGASLNKEDPGSVLTILDRLKTVTPETVKAVANKYLQPDRMFRFVLLPETN